jgi:hypothetical protein
MTYSNNIRFEDMLSVRYAGLRIAPTRAAQRELFKLGLDLQDCVEILDDGYSPRKRAKDTIERWLDKGNKTLNAVIAKDYDDTRNEECWVLIHIGKFTKRK